MELNQLLSFCLASFLMAIMPGPDNLFVITESLAKGKRNGLWIAFGLNSGVLIHTLAAATGLSLILQQSELAFQVVQYLGAAYLIYLAYKAYREKPIVFVAGEQAPATETAFQLFRTGITMNVLNPKVSLFFIAFLPQFVRPESTVKPSIQLIVLGVLFLLVGWLTFSSFAILVDQLRVLAQGEKFGIFSRWLKVIVLLFLGCYLLLPN